MKIKGSIFMWFIILELGKLENAKICMHQAFVAYTQNENKKQEKANIDREASNQLA